MTNRDVAIRVPALLVIASIPAAATLFYAAGARLPDDAYIHLTIVNNVLSGNGWGINPHQPINVSTSPFFILLTTGLCSFGWSPPIVGSTVSYICSGLSILIFYSICRVYFAREILRWLCVILAVFDIFLWRWTGIAMETTLALTMTGLAVRLYQVSLSSVGHERASPFASPLILGLVLGLATLTRYELSLFLPLFAAGNWVRERRLRYAWLSLLALGWAIVVLPWFAYAHATFGSFFPTSLEAKTLPGIRVLNGPGLKILVEVVGGAYVVPILFACVGAYFVMVKGTPNVRRTIDWAQVIPISGFPLLVCVFFYLKTGVPFSPARYYLLALYLLPITLVHIASAAIGRLAPRAAQNAVLGCGAAHCLVSMVLFGMIIVPVMSVDASTYSESADYVTSYLRKHCNPGDVVLMEVDLGLIAYLGTGNCRIADGGGLASPELYNLPIGTAIDHSGARYIVEQQALAPGGFAAKNKAFVILYQRQWLQGSVKGGERIRYYVFYEREP
jgi:hypothetical protein